MIIQSKKIPDRIYEVNVEQWQKMQRLQIAQRFRVLSSHDLMPVKDIETPNDVINYMNGDIGKPEVKKIYDDTNKEELDYNLMLKSELLALAESRNIDVSNKSTKKELINRLQNADRKLNID